MSNDDCAFHVGDVGVKIGLHFTDCTTGTATDIDVSSATLEMRIVKPSGTRVVIDDADIDPADFGGATGDGTDGRVMHVVTAGLLDEDGSYQAQGVATIGAATYHSSVSRFRVAKSL